MDRKKFSLERTLRAANISVDSHDESMNIDNAMPRDFCAFRSAFCGTDPICKLWRCEILREKKELLPSRKTDDYVPREGDMVKSSAWHCFSWSICFLICTICTARCFGSALKFMAMALPCRILHDVSEPWKHLDTYRFQQCVQRIRGSRQTGACKACEPIARFVFYCVHKPDIHSERNLHFS